LKKNIIFISVIVCWMIGGCSPFYHSANLNSHNSSTQSPENSTNLADQGGSLIPEGTKVDDLDLSGTPIDQAGMKIEKWASDKLEESRVLVYNETEIPITLKELGIDVDAETILHEAQRNPKRVTSSVLKVDSLTASQTLEEKLKKVKRPARDASYTIQNDKFVIKPAENGLTVSDDQLISDLQKGSLSEVPKQIKVPLVEVPAAVTTEQIKSLAFDSVLGEYTTNFATWEVNRSSNLTAAAKALDRKAIQPGATLSFNETVGPREVGTGYKEAYVIINGEYVPGTGGGVCQVSSTLYNAVLLSNLGVVERMPHAVAVNYVPAGQDATVNYPNIDFKFKNSTPGIIYLRTEIKPGALTIRIYGKKNGQTIRLERQVEKEIKYKTERRWDSGLPKGKVIQDQKGTNGIVVNVWKILQDGKGNVTRQFLGRDSYAPANRILRIGT
jgi:vancomycin resistance protein YoaR